jgi:hypothetical protein
MGQSIVLIELGTTLSSKITISFPSYYTLLGSIYKINFRTFVVFKIRISDGRFLSSTEPIASARSNSRLGWKVMLASGDVLASSDPAVSAESVCVNRVVLCCAVFCELIFLFDIIFALWCTYVLNKCHIRICFFTFCSALL